PTVAHIAFEALPHLARQLASRFPKSRVFPIALSDASGNTEFYHVKNDPAYSGIKRRSYDRPDPEIEIIRVPCARLDDVVEPSDEISFIKLDIEGGEYHAMVGASTVIAECRPVIVFEASDRSTGHYAVTPDMFYDLLHDEFDLSISTMARWLTDKKPFSRHEFLRAYNDDYYFIAYPAP
ncbi:MAG: FkbM family methyltransferase, partial [Proteobacteria bacterium]